MGKLIVIDLDGTLLNSYGEVSKENKEAIQKSIKNGAEVILASGRIPTSVKKFAKELGTSKYIICGNGAIIYDTEQEKAIYENHIEKNKALNIIKLCEENSIYYSVYTENAIICKNLNYNVLVYNLQNTKKEGDKKTNINLVENVYEYIEKINNKKIIKIVICDSNEIVFKRILERMRKIPNVSMLEISNIVKRNVRFGTENINLEYWYTEISHKNVNKWIAIEKLMQILNITPNDVIAIGDNANDKKMVEKAGIGIIMGNGALVEKNKIAKIVSSNDDNGVAEGIEKYYLNN